MGGTCSTERLHGTVSCPVGGLDTVDPSPRQSEVFKEPEAPAELASAPINFRAKRRCSVSAEVPSLSTTAPHQPKVVEKSDDAKARISAVMQHSFLFKGLEEEQERGIVDAMFEKPVVPDQVIIREGEEGDNLYVIESGEYAAVKGRRQVFKYEGVGAFGELALMYNCPRAATVQALSAGVLWGVDRVTFRAIIVTFRAERRERFEGVLAAMPIFSGLTHEQRAAIADCLEPEGFAQGEVILREGASLGSGAKFYLVESGAVECFKIYDQGKRQNVASIEAGGFFGEVALVTHAPRAADCLAESERVKLLSLGRDAFERLMGPVEEILAEKVEEYAAVDERVRRSSAMPPASTAADSIADALEV